MTESHDRYPYNPLPAKVYPTAYEGCVHPDYDLDRHECKSCGTPWDRLHHDMRAHNRRFAFAVDAWEHNIESPNYGRPLRITPYGGASA